MPEEIVTQTQTTEDKITETVPVQPDLITRVSQVKTPVTQVVQDKFNINELDTKIEAIQDPTVKEQVLSLKKSLLSGENKKYEEIAKLRKDYETKLSEVSTWTPERVQRLLNDPTFVKSAQDVMNISGTSQDDGSMLSEAEKKRIGEAEQMARQVLHQNQQLLQQQQDEALKGRYANYNPETVNVLLADMLSGKIQATREHLWKVIDYESGMQRAYELGKQDRQLETEEKFQSASIEGTNITSTRAPIQQGKGESDRAYFTRIGLENLKKFINRPKT